MTVFIIIEIVFFGLLVAIDLISKHFIMPFLEANGYRYVLIDKVLALRYATNDGAGFSFLSGKVGALIAITVIGLLAVLAFLVIAHIKKVPAKRGGRFLMMVLVMMLAGGVGNLVDRIAFGYVRDFIEYTVIETLFHRSFAICNLADVWLTVGMVLLIVYVLFVWKDDSKKKKAAKAVEPEDSAGNDSENIGIALQMLDDQADAQPTDPFGDPIGLSPDDVAPAGDSNAEDIFAPDDDSPVALQDGPTDSADDHGATD